MPTATMPTTPTPPARVSAPEFAAHLAPLTEAERLAFAFAVVGAVLRPTGFGEWLAWAADWRAGRGRTEDTARAVARTGRAYGRIWHEPPRTAHGRASAERDRPALIAATLIAEWVAESIARGEPVDAAGLAHACSVATQSTAWRPEALTDALARAHAA